MGNEKEVWGGGDLSGSLKQEGFRNDIQHHLTPIPLDRFFTNAFQMTNNPLRKTWNNWTPHVSISRIKVVRIKMKLLMSRCNEKSGRVGAISWVYIYIPLNKNSHWTLPDVQPQTTTTKILYRKSIPQTVRSTLNFFHSLSGSVVLDCHHLWMPLLLILWLRITVSK